MLKYCKLKCPLSGQDTYLTFSIAETTTLASSKKEGTIAYLEKCSLCESDPCGTCPKAAELIGLPVNLE
jgi:hypothetical protein